MNTTNTNSRLMQLSLSGDAMNAGDPKTAGAAIEADADTAASGSAAGEKTFTQAELDRMIGERLSKERRKTEAETAAKIAAARTEAEKLAAMSAEEKAAAAAKLREETLGAREREIARREMRATALETLHGKDLPAELLDTIDMTDAEKCGASIDAIEKAFRAAVEKGVKERMKGTPPKAGAANAAVLPKDPRKASYRDAAALYSADPEAFRKTFHQ